MIEPLEPLEVLEVKVTRSTLLVLRRLARARLLKPEDVASEAVDLHARHASELGLKFADARAAVEKRLATA
jgi:hypothetical protein